MSRCYAPAREIYFLNILQYQINKVNYCLWSFLLLLKTSNFINNTKNTVTPQINIYPKIQFFASSVSVVKRKIFISESGYFMNLIKGKYVIHEYNIINIVFKQIKNPL